MFKQLSKIFLALSAILIIVIAGLPALAQKQASSTEKKNSGTIEKKGSEAGASCDGALDIVPTKTMSFVRKRRPAKDDGKQKASPTDSKSQAKKTDDSKQSVQ